MYFWEVYAARISAADVFVHFLFLVLHLNLIPACITFRYTFGRETNIVRDKEDNGKIQAKVKRQCPVKNHYYFMNINYQSDKSGHV